MNRNLERPSSNRLAPRMRRPAASGSRPVSLSAAPHSRRGVEAADTALRVTRLANGARGDWRDLLFERIDQLIFTDRDRGRLEVRSLEVGGATVGLVESSGHDIVLKAVAAATYLAPLEGRARVETRRGVLETAAGGGVFLRPGDRDTQVRGDGRRPYRALVVLAPPPPRWGAGPGRAPGRATAQVGSDPLAAGLHGFAAHLIAEAARPDSPLLRPAAFRAAEALITDAFAALDDFEAAPSPSEAAAPDRVRLAAAFIRAHSDEPLTVAEIAEAVGVGARALQAGFRARLGLSPRALLAEVRLERARERLLAARPGVTVADIAFESGFAHGGRFAAAYRRRFGESPSETLARILGPNAGADWLR